MWSWDICADTVRFICVLQVANDLFVTYSIACIYYFVFAVRHLPQFPQRALHRVPGQSLADQRQWPVHCLWQLRARLSLGLHPALAQNALCLSSLQQRMGFREGGCIPLVVMD